MRNKSRLIRMCLMSLVVLISHAEAKHFVSTADSIYEATYAALRDLQPDVERSAVVNDLVIQRDVGVITLTSGVLTFCSPVNGRVCAAVFVGDGMFRCRPSTQVEREQCARYFTTASLNVPFKHCVILFSDTTYTSLSERLTWSGSDDSRRAQRVIKDSRSLYLDNEREMIVESVCASLLERTTTDAFWAHFGGTSGREVLFAIDPFESEEVSIGRRIRSTVEGSEVEWICQFHRMSYYESGTDVTQSNGEIDIVHYDIGYSIGENLYSRVTTTMRCVPRYEGRHWIRVVFSGYWKVTEATVDSVDASVMYRGGVLWLYSRAPFRKGAVTSIRLSYEGEIFVRQVDYVYMKTGSSSWYPRTAEISRSTFDLHFHVADNLSFHSAGELESVHDGVGERHYHFAIRTPQIHASFAVGVFEETVIKDDKVPPVRILYERHSQQQENVAQDLMLSLGYYQELFGKPPFEKMTAAQINAYHGQAFPGFLHLSFVTFYEGDASGKEEQFVAHEVAHQWWGGGVGWSDYHDQWMSEAFSEYSSMMYMQSALRNNDQFFYMLGKYKKEILGTRKSFLGNGVEAGPIWLGYRLTAASSTRGDYTMQIYHKGAWVMHMLRNMMMDFTDYSDARYIAMMRDFYQTYKGKDPTTDDFRVTVSRHMGQDMTWFFDQWVYGTKIPKYTVSYTKYRHESGKFGVRMRIKQENVPPTFRMTVPIRINFGDDVGNAPLQINVTGEASEFELPPLPYEPESIDFNIFESVLCEWEMED